MSAATSSGVTHIPSTDLRVIERVVLGAESPDGAKDGCTGLSQEMLVHLLHETTLPRWLGTYHGEMVANVAQSDQDGDLSPFTPQQTWALRMGTCHRYPRSLRVACGGEPLRRRPHPCRRSLPRRRVSRSPPRSPRSRPLPYGQIFGPCPVCVEKSRFMIKKT